MTNWIIPINTEVKYPVCKRTGMICIKAVELSGLPSKFSMYHIVVKPYNFAGDETYIKNVKAPNILKSFINSGSTKTTQYYEENEYYQFDFNSVDNVAFEILDSSNQIISDLTGFIKVVIKYECD